MKNVVKSEQVENWKSGELEGVTSATQLPDVPCSFVYFKAKNGNSTFVYVGGTSGVTKPDTNTDETTGYELDSAEEIGPLPTDNLNRFWYICDATGDELLYLAGA